MYSQPIPSRELTSTLSSKGQVTIPVTIRRHLGIDASDKVAFVIDPAGGVKLTPATYPDVQSLRGVAGTLKRPVSWKEVKRIAHEDRLKHAYGA